MTATASTMDRFMELLGLAAENEIEAAKSFLTPTIGGALPDAKDCVEQLIMSCFDADNSELSAIAVELAGESAALQQHFAPVYDRRGNVVLYTTNELRS